eukprot:TRINITY_DN23245_c0_g1_i1.p1 TRINITY_DN23245_c0_g1~~TRINITY_DN23245_c0_g1_i1.p1  ORF type:complete len:350 (-),score=57.75 TRINITY_DN23245_c0_g1_i1:122-1171(-)
MSKHPNRHGFSWQKAEKRHILSILLALIFLPSLVIIFLSSKRRISYSPSLQEKWNSIKPEVQFAPSLEYINGSEVVWQIPKSAKASLFIAHGCFGSALNFWDRSPNCLNCIGLPEERLVVLHALAHQYAIITISSKDKCWNYRKDRPSVKRILKWWAEKKKLDSLPMFALGASSGGYFVSALATEFKFSAITLMISEGILEAMKGRHRYPATLFVHMPKDARRAALIEKNMNVLRENGVDVDEVKCYQFPLTPSFLSDRIPGLDEKTSFRIFQVLKETRILNKENYMVADGRRVDWRMPLRKKNVFSEAKNEWEMHIQEELNLAFAKHEMTSLQSAHIFDWFDSHLARA